MGWASGTELFDRCIDALLDKKRTKEERIRDVIEAFEDADWDCQQESEYYEHPVVGKVFQAIHPDWFEEEE